MKKTLFYSAIAGIILLGCNRSNNEVSNGGEKPSSISTPTFNAVKKFRTVMDSIQVAWAKSDSVPLKFMKEVYCQKVKIHYQQDSTFPLPQMFIGQFLSSLPHLEYKHPTYCAQYTLIKDDVNDPDDYIITMDDGDGQRISDTLYFYDECRFDPSGDCNQGKKCYPIALVTPDNKIVLLEKDLYLSQVENDITAIMQEIVLADSKNREKLKNSKKS